MLLVSFVRLHFLFSFRMKGRRAVGTAMLMEAGMAAAMVVGMVAGMAVATERKKASFRSFRPRCAGCAG